jgi:hypothetical protein
VAVRLLLDENLSERLLLENADAIERFAAHEDATFLALAFVASAG